MSKTFARIVVLSTAIVVVCLVCALIGCEFKGESPTSHKQLTTQELIAERDAWNAEQKSRDDLAKAEAQRKVRSAKNRADLAVQKLQAQQQTSVAEVMADFADASDSVVGELDQSLASNKAEADKINAAYDGTLADIERRSAVVAGVWAVAKAPIAAFAPGGQSAVSAIDALLGAGLVGTGVAARVQKRRAEAAQGKADQMEEAGKSIVNAIDVLRAKVPAVAEAMKTNKADILGQLTDTAVKLIKNETIT